MDKLEFTMDILSQINDDSDKVFVYNCEGVSSDIAVQGTSYTVKARPRRIGSLDNPPLLNYQHPQRPSNYLYRFCVELPLFT